jgi:hypothetical protein
MRGRALVLVERAAVLQVRESENITKHGRKGQISFSFSLGLDDETHTDEHYLLITPSVYGRGA